MTGTGAEPDARLTPQPESDRPAHEGDAAGPSTAPVPTGPAPAVEPVPTPPAEPGSPWARPSAWPGSEQPAPAYGGPGYGPQSATPHYGPQSAAPPYGAPYGPPAPGGWTNPPAPAGRNTGLIVVAVLATVVVLVACAGVVGGFFALRSAPTAVPRPVRGAPLSPTIAAGPNLAGSEPPAPTGPEASAYPADDVDDLDRVCDENVYYPQSPKRAGKAPHPVVLLVDEGSGIRFQQSTYYFSQGLSKAVEAIWAAKDPKKVQQVACLDRVSTGSKIRSCRYDDPKPDTVSLMRANWRLRVYEAATGRKLLDKAMTGDDQKCPYMVFVRADKKIYAGASDRAVVAALRGLVRK